MDRRLVWAVTFSLGVCAVTLQRSLLPWVILAAIAVVGVGLFWGPRLRLWAFLILGVIWGNTAYHHALDQRIRSADSQTTLEISGTVIGLPRKGVRHIRFDFLILEASLDVESMLVGRTVRLSWYETDNVLTPGSRWRLAVKLRPPRGYRNQHGFDYERFLLENGIQGTGYVREGSRSPGLQTGLWVAVDRFRLNFRNHLDSSPTLVNKPLLIALAVGERSGLDSAGRKLLRESGLSHLVAISGLHIGLAAFFAFRLATGTWRIAARPCSFLPARHVGVVAGVMVALVYSIVAGLPISTIRALVMALIGGALLLACIRSSLDLLLAAAMFLVAIFSPLQVASAGFWLSFSAVWLIFRFASEKGLKQPRLLDRSPCSLAEVSETLIRYFRTLGKLQLVLLVGMMPLLIFVFEEVPLSAPLTNLFAVPIFGFLVVPSVLLGLGAYAAGLPHTVDWILLPADKFISWVLWLAELFSGGFLPSVRLAPEFGATLLMVFGLIGSCVLRTRQFSTLLIVLGMLWGFVLFQNKTTLEEGEFEVTVLDVGQGLAMVVATSAHVLVYDFGPRFGSFNLGEAVVLPHLRGEGHRQIDAAIISHGANDHAGGFSSVLDQFPLRKISTGEPQKTTGDNCHLQADAPWVWDGVSFSFLRSLPDGVREANDRSCVLSIKGKYGRALLTGDIEMPAEQTLFQHYGNGLKSDLLQIPHHGSKTSSTTRFLSATKPQYAALSRGVRNRFNHPDQGVVGRYEQQEAQIGDTAKDGQLSYRSLRAGWQVDNFAKDWARFWH